jgi:hypothetical protein
MLKLGETVQLLQQTLPKNGEGLILAYVDPERIAASGLLGDDAQLPENAVVPISYVDGFATVEGLPFWERLDGELIPAYDLFKAFRDMKLQSGTRSIMEVHERTAVPLRTLTALSQIYHWRARAKCFDAYKEFQRNMIKEREIDLMEGRHKKTATQLFDLCIDFIRNNKELLTPKTALQWFQTAVQLERLSLGLSPDKPLKGAEAAQNSPIVQINNAMQAIQNTEDGNSSEKMLEILRILEQSGALDVRTHVRLRNDADSEPSVAANSLLVDRLQQRGGPLHVIKQE